MALFFYYGLLSVYGVALAVSLFQYLTRKPPQGDASVDWAIGLFYTVGLTAVVGISLLLRSQPYPALAILSLPLIFLALPRLRRMGVALYTRIPALDNTPPLTLTIENNSESSLHVKLECWFGSANSHSSTLYTTFDFYPKPLEKRSCALSPHQTRLLAHKSRFVTVMIYELVNEEHGGHAYVKEIQPCMRYFDEKPEAFRSGNYTVVIEMGIPKHQPAHS